MPFEEQNKPPKKLQEVALGLKLPTGENSGQPGTLDGFGNAEKILTAAAAKQGFSTHIVRSGELRGNGPLLLADLSARLVDNLYDVKYQDLYFKKGAEGQGYTKRLNLAATLLRMATVDSHPARRLRRAQRRVRDDRSVRSAGREDPDGAYRGWRGGRVTTWQRVGRPRPSPTRSSTISSQPFELRGDKLRPLTLHKYFIPRRLSSTCH